MTTPDGWIVLGILAGALAGFAWGRVRPEIVAMTVVLAMGLSGVATPTAAFAGFGDPVVVTIASLLIVSAALERTGVAALSARLLLRAVGHHEAALILALMTVAGVLSGFMNLVGATAMLLPVALAVCRQTGISPSRLLMPLAIAARQGGSLTLIGKASNLIVSGLMVQAGYAPLSFFSFFPVGIAMLVVSIMFMATLGRRLLPARMPQGAMAPTGDTASSGASLNDSPPARNAQVPYALLALGVVVLSGGTGVVQVSLAAVLAAGIAVIGGCVKVTEAPHVVDWPTIIVVGSLLPLGAALHTTGAAAAVAGALLPLAGDAPFAVLAAICVATFVVGQFVPAIPTTILLAPIALSAAKTLGVNPAPFMITVATATSLTLLTPISHPVSMMVMVPGGYRFGDYARVGGPLAVLLGATLLAVVSVVWRF